MTKDEYEQERSQIIWDWNKGKYDVNTMSNLLTSLENEYNQTPEVTQKDMLALLKGMRGSYEDLGELTSDEEAAFDAIKVLIQKM